MKFEDLLDQQNKRMIMPQIEENKIIEQVISLYLRKYPEDKYLNGYYLDPITLLLRIYFHMKSNEKRKYMNDLLDKYNFNYKGSLHNALYYLLGKKNEVYINDAYPELWPGIIDIKKDKTKYTLITKEGTIKVSKASTLFYNTSSYKIFRRQLCNQCYARSYDFVKQNKDFKVVLSYLPNFFYGGFYHAYLIKENQTLDIASNAYYESEEDLNHLLDGEIVKILTYDEIEQECGELSKEIGKIKNKDKLNVLSLYYDARKNHLDK